VGNDSERDRLVERLLKATLRSAGPGAPSSACLDAGAIASWAEASLGPDEATRVEAHLAECSRCQAVLAAFARAEPPAAPAAPVWKRWAVLLPIAAATGTLAIWIAWPPRRTPAPPVAVVAEAPPAAEPRSHAVPLQTSPPAAVPAKRATAPTRSAERSAADVARATKPVAPTMSPSPVFRSVVPPQATPVPLIAPPAAAPPAPVSAAAAARPAVISESPRTGTRLASPTGVVSGLRAATGPVVVFDSPAALGGAAGAPAVGASGGRGGGRPTALREAATLTSGVTRWRIVASQDLERSTDNGRTWERVPIDPPASLTNGTAPSPLICWIVGRAGVVLVTNDAGHFTRLAFPETVDLSAVQATDLLNATVATADGRTFVTTDGGKTWAAKDRLTPRENGLRPAKIRTHKRP
jgi:hypothetical protein